ncbi:MAG TPA: agmatine deiminase family protein [Alphaproteobacteria bacterium]|nr:agmatine deiminase family protein [Alphaproteobacteria bacterium]
MSPTDAAGAAGAGWTFPAEWAPHGRTWMAWPCRPATWHGGIEAARSVHVEVAKAIAQFEPVTMVCNPMDVAEVSLMCGQGIEIVPMPLSDGWMRDIGPTFVVGSDRTIAGIDWIFNGWGGLHNDFAADAEVARAVLELRRYRRIASPIVLEGGAINSDGEGTLLVTEECLLDPRRNPGLGKEEIEQILRSTLGVEAVIWLGKGYDGDETRGHVDEIACFVEPGIIMLQLPRDTSDPNYLIQQDNLARLKVARDAKGRKIDFVLIPQPAYREHDGRRLTLSYVNFALANGGVIIPSFGDSADEPARRAFASLYPDRKIIQILADDLVIGGGGIHCITQQEPMLPSLGERLKDDTA